MAKRLPPIPTKVLGAGTEIFEEDGIRASLSYAYSRGAKGALGRMQDQVAFRRGNVEADLRARQGDPFLLGKLAGYEWAVETIDNLIEEYARET